ncbi:MAG: tRNA (adenosine(37)-N6)-dimethylallyltransferase MiaA [Clostridiales bacterium]|jgi:tRNA dimethylallyltransferase|nr:tRNA (adenosine(37)-N6)-dimethylallyltransferase MiaA [Clostridiales bacterium]
MGEKIQTGMTYFIAGPTAAGKTDLAAALAQEINGEVISADSMQVYRYMNVGTAKPTIEETRGIPHYLIDILNPDEVYSAALFQKMALEILADMKSRGKTPIVAGGSGFYINALLYGTQFQADDTRRREYYLKLAEERGGNYLHNLLTERDPESASIIHMNNIKRVARALTFFELNGKKISEYNTREKARDVLPNNKLIILNMERQKLYEQINLRVDKMFRQGLVEEAEQLLRMGFEESLQSMRAIGYKETIEFLKGYHSLADAKENIKKNTRHFAKRQITWLKNRTDGLWINVDERNVSDIIKTIKLWQG